MTPELKSAWTAALRSGQYVQGRSHFKHPARDEYCCLGVLCAVAGAPFRVPYGETHPGVEHDNWEFVKGQLRVGVDYPECMEHQGCRVSAHTKLWWMNDLDKKSFSEIADWIDENIIAA